MHEDDFSARKQLARFKEEGQRGAEIKREKESQDGL